MSLREVALVNHQRNPSMIVREKPGPSMVESLQETVQYQQTTVGILGATRKMKRSHQLQSTPPHSMRTTIIQTLNTHEIVHNPWLRDYGCACSTRRMHCPPRLDTGGLQLALGSHLQAAGYIIAPLTRSCLSTVAPIGFRTFLYDGGGLIIVNIFLSNTMVQEYCSIVTPIFVVQTFSITSSTSAENYPMMLAMNTFYDPFRIQTEMLLRDGS